MSRENDLARVSNENILIRLPKSLCVAMDAYSAIFFFFLWKKKICFPCEWQIKKFEKMCWNDVCEAIQTVVLQKVVGNGKFIETLYMGVSWIFFKKK